MECSSRSGRTLKKADFLSIYFTSVSHFSYQLAEQLINDLFPPLPVVYLNTDGPQVLFEHLGYQNCTLYQISSKLVSGSPEM